MSQSCQYNSCSTQSCNQFALSLKYDDELCAYILYVYDEFSTKIYVDHEIVKHQPSDYVGISLQILQVVKKTLCRSNSF